MAPRTREPHHRHFPYKPSKFRPDMLRKYHSLRRIPKMRAVITDFAKLERVERWTQRRAFHVMHQYSMPIVCVVRFMSRCKADLGSMYGIETNSEESSHSEPQVREAGRSSHDQRERGLYCYDLSSRRNTCRDVQDLNHPLFDSTYPPPDFQPNSPPNSRSIPAQF